MSGSHQTQLPQPQQQQQQKLSHENFIRYVLYTIPDNKECAEAIMLSSGNSEIHNQNVYDLGPGKRPTWLKSVPALYSKQENKIYLGSVCLAKLNTLLQQMGPMPSSFIKSTPLSMVSAMNQIRYGNSNSRQGIANSGQMRSYSSSSSSTASELLSDGKPAADPGMAMSYADSTGKYSFAVFIPNTSVATDGRAGDSSSSNQSFMVPESNKVTSSDIDRYTSMRSKLPVPGPR